MPIERNFLHEHKKYSQETEAIQTPDIVKGDIIEFFYKGEVRLVYVVTARLKNLLHGLSLKEFPRTYLLEVMKHDPEMSEKSFYNAVLKKRRYEITNSYRTYEIFYISNLYRVKYDVFN